MLLVLWLYHAGFFAPFFDVNIRSNDYECQLQWLRQRMASAIVNYVAHAYDMMFISEFLLHRFHCLIVIMPILCNFVVRCVLVTRLQKSISCAFHIRFWATRETHHSANGVICFAIFGQHLEMQFLSVRLHHVACTFCLFLSSFLTADGERLNRFHFHIGSYQLLDKLLLVYWHFAHFRTNLMKLVIFFWALSFVVVKLQLLRIVRRPIRFNEIYNFIASFIVEKLSDTIVFWMKVKCFGCFVAHSIFENKSV